MNYIDIIILIPIAWAAYKGFSNGLIIEVTSLIALVVGVYCSIHFSHYISDFLVNTVGSKMKYVSIVSFIITFIIVLVAIHSLAHLLSNLLEMIALGLINKIFGAVFSIIKIGFILSVILFFINSFKPIADIIPEKQKQESLIYKPLSGFSVFIFPQLKALKLKML